MNIDETPIRIRDKNPDASPMEISPKEIGGSHETIRPTSPRSSLTHP
jgi:hypothetical protein